MKLPSEIIDELTDLTSRVYDGELTAEEGDRLAALLEDPAARELYVQLNELHGMLEAEPSVHEAFSVDQLPANVVSLPGAKPVASSPAEPAGDPATRRHRHRRGLAFAAAAAVAGATAVLWLTAGMPGPDAGTEKVPGPAAPLAETGPSGNGVPSRATEQPSPGPAAPAGTPEEGSVEGEKPEEQYERAALASLGSGSQKRPPTNFTSEPSVADESVSFNRHIRPILSENCFACHGPDEEARKAELRLDSREGATGGDSPAVVPGDPEASELVARVNTEDSDEVMPPPDSHKTLTAKQKDRLTRWIAEGAEWQKHWAFLPVANRLPEEVERHPIDYFIDRELARNDLSRSPRADRRTLVRRATLDLTGLPPTPKELETFLADDSEDAYEQLIDDLLSRKAFGEHRARYWLDAARYGDTHGLHLDNYREIWPYRDWVIRAFNENKPFDRFTIEQIAGDLLPDPTQAQQVATGFNRCNVTTSEGGAIAEEFLVRYAVDRVSTTSTVWMGMTAGCAQCHDHKFDPITMKDFYSLFAFFDNTPQKGMDGNRKDTPPFIRVYDSPEQEAEAERLKKRASKLKMRAKKQRAAAESGDATVQSVAPDLVDHGDADKPTKLADAGDFDASTPFTVAFRFKLPSEAGRTLLARRTDPDNQHRGWRIFWKDRGIVVELIESHPDKMLKRGVTRRFKPGRGGHFALTYDGSGRSEGIDLYSDGKPLSSRFINRWFDSLEGDFATDSAELLVGGKDPESGLSARVDEFFIAERRLTGKEVETLANHAEARRIEKKPEKKRSKKQKQKLKTHLAARSGEAYRKTLAELAKVERRLSRIRAETPTTLVMAEKKGEPTAHILKRGEYDQKGKKVRPAFPEFLPDIAADEELPMNRLGLAKWLVDPDHPLTARVTVNRMWQQLFGTGLVKTAEDFGTQGESPTHPDLLDWLAHRFVASGWDVKDLYRTIMLSETYRQTSKVTDELNRRDPNNRLLARGPRFRLDAEVIRDQALAASDLLDDEVGGRGVRPYQPSGIWEAVGYTNSNTQTFHQDYGSAAEHRRSIYTFWKRTAPPPNMALFDAPNRESCIVRRERTNTPLQALVLMNDPQFVRASRHLAHRVLEEADKRDARLDRMAELLRARPLDEEERRTLVGSLDKFRNMYGSDRKAAEKLLVDEVNSNFSIRPDEDHTAPQLAAWTMVANQMLNLDQVINKN